MIVMTILSTKWVAILIIVLIFTLLLIFGRKSVETEISIEASPEEVWNILMEVSTIKEWNNVLVPVNGEFEIGNKIKYEFYQEENGKPVVMNAEVKNLVPYKLINQGGGTTGILTFNHSYILSLKNNATTVKIIEKYSGIMVNFWNPEPVKEAYKRLLIQLQERVIVKKSKE